MNASIGAQIEELIGDLQREAARVQATLDYVMDELQVMARGTDGDPPSQIALNLLAGIRERLEETKP